MNLGFSGRRWLLSYLLAVCPIPNVMVLLIRRGVYVRLLARLGCFRAGSCNRLFGLRKPLFLGPLFLLTLPRSSLPLSLLLVSLQLLLTLLLSFLPRCLLSLDPRCLLFLRLLLRGFLLLCLEHSLALLLGSLLLRNTLLLRRPSRSLLSSYPLALSSTFRSGCFLRCFALGLHSCGIVEGVRAGFKNGLGRRLFAAKRGLSRSR